MKKVEILPPEVINFIAAGEIVERPASIVKELLENSLDGGAQSITVKIENNNDDMTIIIEDNGTGIDPQDLPHIFLQHATSKATNISEIIHIKSLGFRGEALWAIGNVSHVQCTTFFQGKTYEIICDNGKIGPVKDQGDTDKTGTSFIIKNIFHQIPVRKKFLKDFQGEYQLMVKTFLDEVFCHPLIGFNWYLNKEMVYCFNTTSLMARLEDITKNSQWTVSQQGEENGYHGILMASHKKRGKFFINLNGRPIDDYKIKNFIKNQMEKQDGVVGLTGGLCLKIPPEDVDVNIHPRKLEVRFKDGITLFNLIKKLVVIDGIPTAPNDGQKAYEGVYSSYKYSPISMKNNDGFIPQKQSHWVSDNLEKNYTVTHLGSEKFLMVKKEKQIVVVHINPIERKDPKSFNSKIITLKPSTLTHSAQWHWAGIKFSIVSENSIIVWEIPAAYNGTMEDFFKTLEHSYDEGNGDWLKQFVQWNQESIIEYIENNQINGDWPLAYCSWIVDLK